MPTESDYEARSDAFVHTGCQGGFDEGWDAGVAHGRKRGDALLLRALDLLDLAARKHLAVTTSFHSTLAALREDAMRELGR